MKFIGLCICIAVLLLASSCKKTEAPPLIVEPSGFIVTDSGSIKGFWELRYVIGCQIANCDPIFEPGNGNTWQFTDSTYIVTNKSLNPPYSVSDTALYTPGREYSYATNKETDFFTKKDSPYGNIFFEINKDTLTLYRGIIAADGSIEKYVRF